MGYSGNHTRTIQLVQSGAYQVGAVNSKVWENEMKAGKIDPSKVSIIWKTPPYPNYQWSIRGDVDKRLGAGFKNRVKEVLLNIEDPTIQLPFQGKASFQHPTPIINQSSMWPKQLS